MLMTLCALAPPIKTFIAAEVLLSSSIFMTYHFLQTDTELTQSSWRRQLSGLGVGCFSTYSISTTLSCFERRFKDYINVRWYTWYQFNSLTLFWEWVVELKTIAGKQTWNLTPLPTLIPPPCLPQNTHFLDFDSPVEVEAIRKLSNRCQKVVKIIKAFSSGSDITYSCIKVWLCIPHL